MLHGHFRNQVPVEDVRKIRKSAAIQEALVLDFFMSRPDGMHTPHAVLAALKLEGKVSDKTPITSIRRAITDLTNDGELEKVDHNRMEVCGVTNKCWKLIKKQSKTKPEQLELLGEQYGKPYHAPRVTGFE